MKITFEALFISWHFLRAHSISIATIATVVILFLQYMYDRLNRRNVKVMKLRNSSLTGMYKVVNKGSGDVSLEKYGTCTFDGNKKEWDFAEGTKLKPDDVRELSFCEAGGFISGNFRELLRESLKFSSKHIYYVYVDDALENTSKFYPQGIAKSLVIRFWYWITCKKLNYSA